MGTLTKNLNFKIDEKRVEEIRRLVKKKIRKIDRLLKLLGYNVDNK